MNEDIPQDSPASQPQNLNDLSIKEQLAGIQALVNEIDKVSGDVLLIKMLSRVSTLQVSLSEVAEKSTQKVVRLTWALLVLTVALLVLGVFQLTFTQPSNQFIEQIFWHTN